MRNALKNLITASILAASLAGAPVLFAATQNHASTTQPEHMRKMVQGNGQMGSGMNGMGKGNMMPMMKMMAEMNQMMSNCNQMMRQHMGKSHLRMKQGKASDQS